MFIKKVLRNFDKLIGNSNGLHKTLAKSRKEFEVLPSHPDKVIIDMNTYEEMTNVIQQLAKTDKYIDKNFSQLKDLMQKNSSHIKFEMKKLRASLAGIKENLKKQQAEIVKSSSQISQVVKEFRERCRNSYLDYLKTLDIDLRKILKPLVPTQVVEDNIKYPPITKSESLLATYQSENELPSKLQSLKETPNDSEKLENPEGTMERMDAHVQLLVGTLETVAKDLIEVCKDANERYYSQVKPTLISSEPPTPLAAPLPEYFIFETNHAQKESMISQIGELKSTKKKKVLDKLLKLQDNHSGSLLTQAQENKIRKMLSEWDASLDLNLLNSVFEEGKGSLADKEKLAYEMIHSRKNTAAEMVTLNDLLEEDDASVLGRKSPIQPIKSPYVELEPPPIKSREKTPPMIQKGEETPPEIADLDNSSSVDSVSEILEPIQNTPVVSAQPKPMLFDQKRKSLPPISRILSEKRIKPSHKIKRQISAGRFKKDKDTTPRTSMNSMVAQYSTPSRVHAPLTANKSEISFRSKSRRRVVRK